MFEQDNSYPDDIYLNQCESHEKVEQEINDRHVEYGD